MTGSLGGKVALVTGASSGIGEAAALRLAHMGARVAVSARRTDRLEALVARIEAAGGVGVTFPGDARDEHFAAGTVEQIVARFGRLDILVNAAGIMPEGGVESADAALWRKVMEVNFLGCLQFSQAAIRPMRTQGGGDIINISSTSGRRVASVFGIYSTSKFALNAMSESLRQEVGGHGIRVCVIEPGATSTELWEGVADPELRKAVQQRAQRAQREGAMKPEDIADAIAFVVTAPPRVNVSEMLIRPTSDVAPL